MRTFVQHTMIGDQTVLEMGEFDGDFEHINTKFQCKLEGAKIAWLFVECNRVDFEAMSSRWGIDITEVREALSKQFAIPVHFNLTDH